MDIHTHLNVKSDTGDVSHFLVVNEEACQIKFDSQMDNTVSKGLQVEMER